MGRYFVAIGLVAIAHQSPGLGQDSTAPQRVLSQQLTELGRSFKLVDAKLDLYAVTDEFILQPVCQNGILASVHVSPKYYYRTARPEWKEPSSRPYLPAGMHQTLIKRLEPIRPLGKIVTALMTEMSNAGVNFKLARFENGILQAMFHPLDPPRSGAFGLFYFRPVSGVAEDVLGGKYIQVDGHPYWGITDPVKVLRSEGRVNGAMLAGPVDSNAVLHATCSSR